MTIDLNELNEKIENLIKTNIELKNSYFNKKQYQIYI